MAPTCFGDLGGLRAGGCWDYRLKLVHRKAHTGDAFLKDVKLFSLKSIQKATNNFSTRFGEGGFSSSYKGTLHNGTSVVVKLFGKKNSSQKQTLESLINVMSRIRHKNVVEFIGCCVEGDQWMLVYEFAGHQSLDQWLFHSFEKDVDLSWSMRASICLGIARGLDYLHNGISERVVHRDIKPSNVVLDENYNPKIVEFELAHLFDDKTLDFSDLVCGTVGYLDPEYCATGRFSEKADVYAFGILLLEVITGRKVINFWVDHENIGLVEWVRQQRHHGKDMEIVDPKLTEFPQDEVTRFIDVALHCVQSSSNLRPSMYEVLLMLSGGYDLSKKAPREPDLPLHASSTSAPAAPAQASIAASSTLAPTPVLTPEIYTQPTTLLGQHTSTPTSGDKNLDRYASYDRSKPPSYKFKRVESMVPVTKAKIMRKDEIEIESDPETEADSEPGQLQTSQDLEAEFYRSIESKIPPAVSESGPSDKTLVKSEIVSSSLENEVLVEEGGVEVGKQMLISHDWQGGLKNSTEPNISPSFSLSGWDLETSHEVYANSELMATTSAQAHIVLPSEIDKYSFQEDLPLKVDPIRPILCTLEKIFEALEDGQSRIICLHGRSGSGKTTVLKTLRFHPSSYLFDEVIFVTIPRFTHRRTIQSDIMQQLAWSPKKMDSYSEDEIAVQLCQTLKMKKVLLLFDDVWEIINLHDVGIPDPSPDNSCWLVLATRSLDVCHSMADKEIEMELLSKVEAWGLFCNQVGNVVDSPEIEPYARAIVEECHGLSLIIAAIASVLKMKSNLMEWKFALWSFQNPCTHSTDSLLSLSPLMKYCYKQLKGRDVKICFLYCALFPRGKEIDITMLVDCFIAEGLLGRRTVAAHKRGHEIVGQLVNASLLEATEAGVKVKMHNVIKDLALAILSSDAEGYEALTRYHLSPSIAPVSEQDEVQSLKEDSSAIMHLTSASAQLKEPPALEEWERAETIFLMDNELCHLPSQPSCPNLEALFLQRNRCLRVIPASFFDGMCNLRILNLCETRIKSLPDSFAKLKNLEVLALRNCERLLFLPPSIGLLKALQVLDLEGTELMHLPETVGQLANLKHLRVSFYELNKGRKLPAKLIPSNTISNLKYLRELGIFVHPGDGRWTSCASDIVEDISNLNLSTLFFHFPEVDNLEHFLNKSRAWTSSDLTKFNLIVGRDFKHVISQVSYDAEMMYSGEERCLRFVNGESIPFAVPVVLSRATSFYLDHHLSISSLSDFGIEIMHFLKICILRDCTKLLAIVNKDSKSVVLPFLEYLSANYLWNLEEIWVDHLQKGSFAKLRHLSVHACPKLRFVFTSPMLDILTNLEELFIEDNASLEYIVIEDKATIDDDVSNKVAKTSLEYPVLRSLKVLKLHYQPKLSGIWTGGRWPPLEYVSFYNCPKLKNLHLSARGAKNIKEISADKSWWDSLDWDDLALATRLGNLVREIGTDDL